MAKTSRFLHVGGYWQRCGKAARDDKEKKWRRQKEVAGNKMAKGSKATSGWQQCVYVGVIGKEAVKQQEGGQGNERVGKDDVCALGIFYVAVRGCLIRKHYL